MQLYTLYLGWLYLSNIFPEAIPFSFVEQEESVKSPQEKHYFTTKFKRGHFYFQSGTKQSFNTSFPRLRSLSQKKCLCSNSQLSNCKTPISGLMFCIKRSIEHTCAVVAHVCEKHFPFHEWEGGVEPADYLEL